MPKILIGTHNRGKFAELKRLLAGLEFEIIGLSNLGVVKTPDETGSTLEQNAILKARAYGAISGLPTLADDSGLEVEALDGAPGVLSARYGGKNSDSERNAHLLEQLRAVPLARRQACFKAVLAFVAPQLEQPVIAVGRLYGTIATKPSGSGGFGYDPIFYLPNENCTVAELTHERKNLLSHRGHAVRSMCDQLSKSAL